MIPRRTVIAGLGAAAAWPLTARAQLGGRVRRVGVLEARPGRNDPQLRVASFRRALETLGWSEGFNIQIDIRFLLGASGDENRELAKELVSLQPDVIVAYSTPGTIALQRETRVIPIVFLSVSDPVGSGFVASLARPGGNITGLLAYEEGIAGKWMSLLSEVAPRLARVGLLGNPANSPFDYFLRGAQAAAPSLALGLVPMRVSSPADIERAIASFTREPDGGLVAFPGVLDASASDPVLALAAKHRLPAIYSDRGYVAAGGLISYGPVRDVYVEAAPYVDRILRGAKPADLPVQAPTKYETVINLKTAKALGLNVPAATLVRADEVIE
jgi:putative ABC transport system substrate-binding protein